MVIAHLDKLSRDEDVQQKLQAPDAGWDLVVRDEAHKLSATFFGGEVKHTKRYRLGQLLSGLIRHFWVGCGSFSSAAQPVFAAAARQDPVRSVNVRGCDEEPATGTGVRRWYLCRHATVAVIRWCSRASWKVSVRIKAPAARGGLRAASRGRPAGRPFR